MSYEIETHDTSAGLFVEIWDSDYSEDDPAAFMSAEDAREMAEAILTGLEDKSGGPE